MTLKSGAPSILLLAGAMIALAAAPALLPRPGSMLAIVNGRIIDGTGAAPMDRGTVLVEGGRIVACGPAAKVPVPAGAQTIDARGKTVLPGLIDAHVHNAFDPALRRRLLETGITSVCDLGSPLARMGEFAVDESEGKLAARGLKAGPIITAIGGLPDVVYKLDLNYEVGTAEQARQTVSLLRERGADVLKVYLEKSAAGQTYPVLSAGTLRPLMAEARARGLLVRAHVTKLAMLPLALEAGVDSVDHIPKPDLTRAGLEALIAKSAEPEKALYDALVVPEYESAFPAMIRKGIVLVPTLMVMEARYKLDPQASRWQKILAQGEIDLAGRYRKLGGTVALGTDFNPANNHPLDHAFKELELFRAAGLSPMDVIVAATKNAACLSGHARDLGTIEPGKLADLIVLDEDPLQDPAAWKSLRLVIRDGRVAWERAANPPGQAAVPRVQEPFKPISASGPYFGQKPPGLKAERFAPGIVSTERDEHSAPVFAKDGASFYLSRIVGPPWTFQNLLFRMAADGSWSSEAVRFDHDEKHAAFLPSRDGSRLYCESLRPLPGTDAAKVWHFWVMDLDGKGGPSRPLPPPVRSDRHECQLFEAADGSFYFTSWRNGSPDLFRAVERNGEWLLDEGFGPGLNSPEEDKGAFVSDDGRLLLFWSNRPGGAGKDDIYLSRRRADGGWDAPVNAGPLINSPSREWCPRLSPDGRYLFFLSDRTGDFDVYWIDASVLE